MWTKEDITKVLSDPLPNDSSKTSADLFSHHYDVQDEGNVKPHQVCGGCGFHKSLHIGVAMSVQTSYCKFQHLQML